MIGHPSKRWELAIFSTLAYIRCLYQRGSANQPRRRARMASRNADVMATQRRKSSVSPRPEWANVIAGLRQKLNLNQVGFSKRFNCSPMAVSRWERGVLEPPAQTYIELGNIAGDPSCWFFWERAGLTKADVLRVIPRLQKHLRQAQVRHLEIVRAGSAGKAAPREKLKLVAIPLLKTVAASHGERGDIHSELQEAPVESMIAAPRDWCPHPSTTTCVRVRGNSMSPLIYDGYILAVDSSQNNVGALDGKIVIAWHKDLGLTVSRLRHYDHTIVLQPENSTHESLTLSGKHKWKIIARVLWWIGKAP
jgi:SOS-response transcriptional repressor LexA/DNA-binding transcriptional regulator YiaG